MKHSEMLNLNLPEDNDLINVGHLSGNFEKIDSAFQTLPIKQEESKTDIDVMACPPYWTMHNATDEDIVYIDHNFFDEEFTLEAGQTIVHEIEEPENIRISSEVTIDYIWFIPASEAFSGGGGGGGTSDYNKLNNLPTINNVEIKNNKTADDLGLVAKEKDKGLSTNDFTNDYKAQLDGLESALASKLDGGSVGVAGGVASLGSDGKVPSSQLPGAVAQNEYKIIEVSSESYAKSYKLQQKSDGTWSDITDSASINIPKDMVVESGSVKECTTDNVPVSGYKKGDKYIDLVIANKADAHIYINVKDLINNKAEGIQYSNTTSKLTSTNVQSAIDEIAETLKNTIESPNVGEVGQVLTIKTVDSSGKPTEWEYTGKGGGGEGGTTNYNDLSNKPAIDGNTLTKDSTASTLGLAKVSDIPTVPTKVSQLENDSGYSTFSGSYNDLSNKPELFSGSYNDLTDKPEIPEVPTNLSAFNNDVGYTTFDGNYNSLSNKPEGLYSKPEGGIPASDMSQGVQESLGKADTALQEHQSLEDYVKTNDSRLTDARASNDVQSYAKTGSGITVDVSVPSNAKFTDTTYTNKAASSGGTDVSLVTTGEKYTWNNKVSAPQTATVGQILAVKAVDSNGKPTEWETITNTASGTSIKVGDSGSTYSPTNGIVTIPAYPTSLPANGGTAANVSGTVAIAHGGTGATSASSARTNLGLGGAAVKSVDTSFTGSSTSINLPTTASVVNALKNEYKIYPHFSSSYTTLTSGSILVVGNQIHIDCTLTFSKDIPQNYGFLVLPFNVTTPLEYGQRYYSPDGWSLSNNSGQLLTSKSFSKGSVLSIKAVFTKSETVQNETSYTVIPTNSDIKTYITPGHYRTYQSDPVSMKNLPSDMTTTGGFVLIVDKITDGFIIQKFYTYAGTTHIRCYSGGTWLS